MRTQRTALHKRAPRQDDFDEVRSWVAYQGPQMLEHVEVLVPFFAQTR
jgi:hypothetical protein